ncbi:MAG: tripartite tricarboxylate transporter TctB family protein [Rhodobiaceae bacterium]|nr:tripartite tricarboxylate transporter TctB family protein [Rhodobiaceae bacterium]
MERRPLTEIVACALIIVVCAVFWVQAYKLPPGVFEPMGSGPVPMYTSALIILCCVVVIVRAVRTLINGHGFATAFIREFAGGAPVGAVWMVVVTLAYAALLHLRAAPFGLITFLYLALLIWALERFRPRMLAPALITAAVFAFGAEYLFTHVFVVDLPT